jgi:hypothetical protein
MWGVIIMEKEKKGFIESILEKLDKLMKKESKKKGCCEGKCK